MDKNKGDWPKLFNNYLEIWLWVLNHHGHGTLVILGLLWLW